jgi:hypothetical protein
VVWGKWKVEVRKDVKDLEVTCVKLVCVCTHSPETGT